MIWGSNREWKLVRGVIVFVFNKSNGVGYNMPTQWQQKHCRHWMQNYFIVSKSQSFYLPIFHYSWQFPHLSIYPNSIKV